MKHDYLEVDNRVFVLVMFVFKSMLYKVLALPALLLCIVCTCFLVRSQTPVRQFLGRTVDGFTGVTENVRLDAVVLNVYGSADYTESVLSTTETFVGLYFDGEYAFAVSKQTAQQLADYLSKAGNSLAVQKQAQGVQYSKDIEFSPIANLDGKYVFTYEDALAYMNRDVTVYRTQTVTPSDTLQSLADHIGVTVDELYTYAATYNGTLLAEDWAEHTLIPGAQIVYPDTSKYLTLYYVLEQSDFVAEQLPVTVIYDDTMYADELVVDYEGVLAMKDVTYHYVYDADDNYIRTEIESTVDFSEGVPGVVRIGTKPSRIMAETGNVKCGKYFTPITDESAYISAYMGDNRGHKGVDIAAPYATPIYAAASGIVTDASGGWNSGYGNAVVIENDDGNICRYAHMSWYVVAAGDSVEQGQLIGYVGSTGNSTGNHLHFEVICNGIYHNPLKYITIDGA